MINDANTGPTLDRHSTTYARLLNDPEVWQRFSTTAGFVIPAVRIELLLGFGLAMLLNRKLQGARLRDDADADPDDALAAGRGALLGLHVPARRGVINYWIHDVFGLSRRCSG